MTSEEFAALKAGDRIEVAMNEYAWGTVTNVSAAGVVKVKWGPSPVEFSYTANTTIWMHWNKADEPKNDTEASVAQSTTGAGPSAS